MTASISRRFFLGSAAAGGMTLLATRRFAPAQQPGALRVRKSASELPAKDPVFAKYAKAVQAMHELPPGDRRNWRAQAKIHADYCKHGHGFLPWHRHYINQFEKICGELIGDRDFALPYWDWSYGVGTIPDPFFDLKHLDVTFWKDPGVYSSSNWGDIDTIGIRAIAKGLGVQNDRIRGAAFTRDNINSILAENDFERFTGRLEGSPHNTGHVVVGYPATGKPGHIGSGLSPLDPLFWLHHCNVDRLWAQWQLAGNIQPDFVQKYDGQFVDASGKPIDLNAADAVDFSALGYTYQQFERPRSVLEMAGIVKGNFASQPLLTAFRHQGSMQATEPVALGAVQPKSSVEVGIPRSIAVPVKNIKSELSSTRLFLDANLPELSSLRGHRIDETMLAEFGKPKTTLKRIFASIKGVRGDFASPPVVNIFVNCPYLSPQTPYTDVHYADTFALFGPQNGGHDHEREFIVDLTSALQNVDLNSAKELKFQLMAAGPDVLKPAGSFSVESIEIFSA
jgi:tyrosinase